MHTKIIRNRIAYFLLIMLTIIVGLISRTNMVPDLIYPYIGDFFYAVMFYFTMAFIFHEKSPMQIAIISIVCCYFIEFLQFYKADWIDAIRATKIGGLVLGFGFLWTDVLSYTLGGLSAYLLETNFYKRREKL